MANFEDMAMLLAINNVEEHEHHDIYNERQTRNRDIITDPFTLSHRLFVKDFRFTKDVVRDLINLLKPHIVSNHLRSSAIDLNTKVRTYPYFFFLVSVNFLLLYIVINCDLFII